MARKKVYVSSTFKDLEEYRSAVKATLERAGFDVDCMEKYPAFDKRPKDKCLADVAECDYCVLILAWRYGFQPEDDNPRRLSITHLEYEEAVGLKKPCLAFMLDPEHTWPPGRVDPNALSSRSKIGKFRQTLEKRHGRRFFTTPDSLARAIYEALRAEEQKHLTDGEKAKAQIRESYLAGSGVVAKASSFWGWTSRTARTSASARSTSRPSPPGRPDPASRNRSARSVTPCFCTAWEKIPSTSPAPPVPASPPSAAGWPCWRRAGRSRTIPSLPRRNSGRRCRIRCAAGFRSCAGCGIGPAARRASPARATGPAPNWTRASSPAGWTTPLRAGSPGRCSGRRSRRGISF
jgi:hypothetical protein